MNLIINGFHDASQIHILDKLVEKFNFNYIHHISSDGILINSTKSGTNIQTSLFYIIGDGNYDFSDCPPLDESIIEKMLPYESTILKLMNRLELYSDKGYDQYKNRYSLYLKHLKYWSHIIKSKQIDLFISQNIPHEVYDYVIYALCKINKIPVLLFFQIQMHDTTFVVSDINNWQKDLLPEYKRIQQVYETKQIEEIKLSNNVLLEWSFRANRMKPFYMNKSWYGFKNSDKLLNISRPGNKNRFKKIINPFKSVKFICFLFKKAYRNKILFYIYSTVCSLPDYSKKYIYFPLHLQPELTTCPLGGAMENQALVAEIISKSLPADVFLYIKENPKQGYLCRGYKFYHNLLKSNKNIIFVSRDIDTNKLIENSIAVATVTGTAGWEALFEKKQVLIFGNYFYDSAPGVFKIKSPEECRLAIENIISNEFKYDEKKLKLFLQAVSNVSINGSSNSAFFCVSSLSIEENNDKMYSFIEKYLKEFLGTAN